MDNIESRLEKLEAHISELDADLVEQRAAHVRLAAEHFALANMFMAISSLISADADAVRIATLLAFDAASAAMEQGGNDPEFRKAATAMLDDLTAFLTNARGGGDTAGKSSLFPKP